MALQKELWHPVISENLFKGLESIKIVATDDSTYRENKTIHLPSAGAAATVTAGNSTYPVAVAERTDQEVTYSLTNYEFGPLRLGWADALQLSYDKMASLINDMMGGISNRVARDIMISWYHYTAGQFVMTSGSVVTKHAPGTSSGTAKALTGYDLRRAASIMDKQLIPADGRYLIADSIMFWQLMDDLAYNADRIEVVDGLPTAPGNPYGFTVVQMPHVVYTDSQFAARAFGNAGASTDLGVALAVQKSAVSFASTDVETFDGAGRPEYFGDIISGTAWAGGSYRRFDKYGVVPIIQTHSA